MSYQKSNKKSFQSYQTLCEFGALLFSESPDEKLMNYLIEQNEIFTDAPYVAVSPTAAEEMTRLLERAQKDKEGFITDVRQDYTYLFYMVGLSHTSPFESVYRTDDKTLFGPTTLEVRSVYRAYGAQIKAGDNVPDDHFGFELEFVSHLLMLIVESTEKGEETKTQAILEDLRSFLAEHILVFAPLYLKNVKKRAQSEFFRLVSSIMLDTITSLATALEIKACEQIDEKRYILDEH